ncbi:MAG: phosphate acyltransferase PlsX [Bacteroidetes bacterium]|nr:phosphate acyltransferase PlsX [Bacteroidota bacterium]
MENSRIRIAVDAMGGDFAPEYPVLGAVEAAKENPGIDVFLVGPEDKIKSVLDKNPAPLPNLKIVNADEYVTMDDVPAEVFKTKPGSSLNVALRMQREKQADALVSAGNTGAVLTHSTLRLGRIPGVGRATIGAQLPTMKGSTMVFDVGATVDCKPGHLVEYAVMGSIFVNDIYKIENPTVGLLSIGEEKVKGNALSLEAYELLEKAPVNFVGNIEGGDILRGKVDVVICDGYVGNILLKLAESVLDLLKFKFREYAELGFFKKIWIGMMYGTMKKILKKFDYQEQGGTPLLGVNGVSIIGHGKSTPYAIKKMIFRAEEIAKFGINKKIESKLKEINLK